MADQHRTQTMAPVFRGTGIVSVSVTAEDVELGEHAEEKAAALARLTVRLLRQEHRIANCPEHSFDHVGSCRRCGGLRERLAA